MASVIFPNIIPSLAGFNISYNTRMQINKISGAEVVTENPGERWTISLNFNVLRRSEAMQIRSHLNELHGHVNKSIITDLGHDNTNSLPGAPAVDGAGQYGMVLNVKGLSVSQVVAEPGHRFKLGERVHEITRQASSDGTGKATLYLANEILVPTIDNDPISTSSSSLTIPCRWADPRQITQFQGNKSHYRNIRLTFIEALS